jgi:hypothetical protein
MMSLADIGLRLLAIIGAIFTKTRSAEDVAKDLVDLAFDTGIAPAVLMQYLTERGRLTAEAIADIAEAAKLAKFPDNPFGKPDEP